MYMEAVQRYVINMTKDEAIELRDAIGNIPSGMIKDNGLELMYLELIKLVGHKYDEGAN